jgi:hypothetical protein
VAVSTPVLVIPLWLLIVNALPVTQFTTLNGCVALLLVAACSYTDIRWGTIHSSATCTALAWGLVLGAIDTWFRGSYLEEPSGLTPPRWLDAVGAVGLGESVAGAALAFAVMLPVHRFAGGSAGDVKLGTALGALFGPAAVLDAVVWTYVLAGVALVVWVIVRSGPLTLLRGLAHRLGSRVSKRVTPPSEEDARLLQHKVHLAPFFALGTVAVLASANSFVVSAVFGE